MGLMVKNTTIKSSIIFSSQASQTQVPDLSREVCRVVLCLARTPSSAALLAEGSEAAPRGGEQEPAC